jgi:hypothetical protein
VNRKELVALHTALSAVLTWPEPVLEQVAAWLAPEAAPKPGNGLDRDPPRVASSRARRQACQSERRRAEAPRRRWHRTPARAPTRWRRPPR